VPDAHREDQGRAGRGAPDHLAADVTTALTQRNPWLDVTAIEDVYWGAANQAGEDNRNVARMAVLLAGLPVEIPGATVNRLCGSGMEAVCDAARTIAAGEADVCLAGVRPLARYAGAAAAGVHPDYMGIGPVPAMNRVLGRAGWRLDEVDLLEVNEAFAAQSVAVVDELKADQDRVNVNGGAIAIGHPLGCSGARIVTTLLHEMRRRGASRGAASMCIGVGQGIASLWEAA
jgi:acetyl-CoA acyltransferase